VSVQLVPLKKHKPMKES